MASSLRTGHLLGLILTSLGSRIVHLVLCGQLEVVVDVPQLLDVILLQTNKTLQLLVVFLGAVQAVNHMLLLLLPDEEDPKHLHLTLATEVSWF